MAETLIQFEPDALKKRIAESVQVSFGMLIPESEWQKMVDKEVKAFFEEEGQFIWQRQEELKNSSYYGQSRYYETLKFGMTPFRQQVWECVNKLVKQQLETALNVESLRTMVHWGNEQDKELSIYLESKLAELAPKMAASMFRTLFASAVEQVKNDIRNELVSR